MAENEKVTIQFNSIADEGQGQDILISGAPVELFASVDNLESLSQIQGLPIDENVFVYVRNVLNSTSRQQSAFYMHDCKTKIWKEVLLGSHSHENKELLDQLGQIDVENLPNGMTRMLAISKIDLDPDENKDIAYKYKLEWKETPPELPEIPEDMLNTPAYLTVENGNYVWKNQMAPAQTFQYKQVVVSDQDLPNKLRVDNIVFNKDNGDTILLFDNGQFVYDFNIIIESTDEENNTTLYIETTKDIFEVGETISLLVIKNGVQGFLEIAEKEFLTKAEAVEILSGKGLSLYKYATKNDLKKKADKQHTHSQFSKVGHDHDDRYAMYSHSHDGFYLQYHEVYAVIAGFLSNLMEEDYVVTEEDINRAFSESIQNLNNSLLSLINQKVDTVRFEAEIASLREDFNTDEITVTVDGVVGTLSDYLKEIQIALEMANSTSSNVSYDTTITVNLGEGESLGGYKNGDIIDVGTTLQEFTTKLLTNRVPPKLIDPQLNLKLEVQCDHEHKDENYEPGDKNVCFTAKFEYIQNDAGSLEYLFLKILSYNGTDEIVSTQVHNVTDLQEYTFTHDIYDNKSFEVVLEGKYLRGPLQKDNLGKENYFIEENFIKTNKLINGIRRSFIGKFNPLKGIRSAKITETPTKTFILEVKGYQNLHDIVMAFPAEQKVRVDGILYLNQFADVRSLFEETNNVMIEGANGYPAVPYDVFHYHAEGDLNETLYFRIRIGEDDLYGSYN